MLVKSEGINQGVGENKERATFMTNEEMEKKIQEAEETLKKGLCCKGFQCHYEEGEDSVVSIEKAGSILGKSKPTTERYIKSGHLTPVIPTGGKRAIGVTLKSVRDFGKVDSRMNADI